MHKLTAILVLLLVLNITTISNAKSPATNQPTEIIFKVDFNDLTTNAGTAAGSGRCSLTRDLGASAKEGVKGVGLLLDDAEKCEYSAKGNFPGVTGTISLWVKPYNWKDNTTRFQEFFILTGGANNKTYYMTINSPPIAGGVNFGISIKDLTTKKRENCIVSGAVDWSSGKWHNITATWNKKELKLYVDGLFSSSKPIKGHPFAALPKSVIKLVPHNHFKEMPTRSRKDRTLIDEVTIWNRVLNADQVLANYTSVVGGSTNINRVPVPRLTGKITLDGKLDETGWTKASQVPIITDVFTVYPIKYRSSASLCYNSKYLYIAIQTPARSRLKAAELKRDGALWTDDSVEIYLSPDKNSAADFYQFIVNSKDNVYDNFKKRTKWNSTIKTKSTVSNGIWTMEAAIPFSDFNKSTPKPGDIWLANFCRNWYRGKNLRPDFTEWAYVGAGYAGTPDRLGRLVFAGKNSGVKLITGQGLELGKLSFTLQTQQPQTGKIVFSERDRSIINQTITVKGKKVWKSARDDFKDGNLSIELAPASGGNSKASFIYDTKIILKELVTTAYIPAPVKKRLGLKLGFSSLDNQWHKLIKQGKAKIAITLTTPNGTASTKKFTIKQPEELFWIPCLYKKGSNLLNYIITADGSKLNEQLKVKLEIPDLSWVNNKIGVTDEVLTPWTPLVYAADNTISFWNRSYSFNGPFLSKIIAKKQPMLRAPITMNAVINGTDHKLTVTSRNLDKKSPNRAEMSGTANFKNSQLKVDWSSWLEYDGLTVATVTIKPPAGGITIEQLKLSIPLRSDVVKYIRGTRQLGALKSGRLPWNGKIWQSGYEPYIWLSNEYEGFLYFCESAANWLAGKNSKHQITVLGGKNAGMMLTLINRKTKLTKPFSYTFGFQATPVKPFSKKLHAWNFGSYKPTKHQTAQPWFTAHSKQEGRWGVHNGKKLLEFDQAKRKRGITQFYYSVASSTPENNPTFNLYKALWLNPYSITFGPYKFRKFWVGWRKPEPPYYMPGVDPSSPSFINYKLYNAYTMLNDYGIRALYSDMDGVYGANNELAGTGFKDIFGNSGPTYPILGKRQFAKRLAALLRTVGGERRYWMTHEHTKLVPPIHAWADFWWPGEELTNVMYKKTWFYMDELDDVAWRAEYSSTSSGLEHLFLPEFVRGTKNKADTKDVQPSESLLAMCIVNDINTSGSFLNAQALETLWSLKAELGITEADRILYWEKNCPVKALTPKALASVYFSKEGPVIAIANRQPNRTTIKVKLDLKKLGLAPNETLTAYDARLKKNIMIKAGILSTSVDGRNYTLIKIKE
ncbi:MAG: DUF6067 family protein [Victivallaceae bacterium]|nr:DUF6067 family protein [Victivallaceae bacterium]